MINDGEIAMILLRLVEIIGEDNLKDLGTETLYFIVSTLNKLNIDTGNSLSHIIPIILKDEKKCLKLKKKLENKGFFLKIIKSPTVLKGTERIRLSLTSSMKKKSLSDFCESMKNFLTSDV